MASIVKKRDRYYARIIYQNNTGKRREKTFSLGTKQKAKAKRLIPEIQERENLFKAGMITLDQAISGKNDKSMPLTEIFLEHLKLIGRNDRTIDLYERTFSVTEKIINLRNPSIIQREDFKVLLTKLKKDYKNFYTINGHLRNIRAYLNWLFNEGKIEKIPFKVTLLPIKRRKPHYFSNKEMFRILWAARKNRELFSRIIVHAYTGLRLNEFDKSYYHEGYIRTYDPFKNGLERDIPISSTVLRYYHWLKKHGKHISTTISKEFLEVVKALGLYKTKSGVKRSFHCLRSTFAVKTYYVTRDIYRVKTLLGHASVVTSELYCNFDLKMLEKDFSVKTNNKKSKIKQKSINSKKKKIKSKPKKMRNYASNYLQGYSA